MSKEQSIIDRLEEIKRMIRNLEDGMIRLINCELKRQGYEVGIDGLPLDPKHPWFSNGK